MRLHGNLSSYSNDVGYVHFVPSYFPGVMLVTAAGFMLCKTEHNLRNFSAGTILMMSRYWRISMFFTARIEHILLTSTGILS